MQNYDIHVCLVSDQATPNLSPVLSENFRPRKKVILIVSPEMKEQAEMLEKVYRKHQIVSETEMLEDAYNIEAIQKRMETLIEKNAGSSIALNLTGGTKPMAIAAQSAFFYQNKPYFYVHHVNNEILLHDENKYETLQVNTPLTMEDYLSAHGFEVNSMEGQSYFSNESTALTNLRKTLALNANTFSTAIGTLNRLAQEAEQNMALDIPISGPGVENEHFRSMLDMYQEAKVLSVVQNRLRFPNEKMRFFANGGWLEEYVYLAVLELKKKIQDFGMNMKVNNAKNKSENELDVAFLSKNRLYLIECKTRNFFNDKKIGTNTLYKLDSLTALGGLNTKGMLVSYRKLDDATKQRAKDLRIKTIEADQLVNLKNQISSWIS